MATAEQTTDLPIRPSSATSAACGVAGGIVGGAVFGVLMQMMDMIPMVAALAGGSSTGLGWAVHLTISVFFGAAFGLLASRWLGSLATATVAGAGYGLVLWAIGPLLLMPAKLGMPLMEFSTTVWQSLMGHLVYGVLLGLVASLVARKVQR